MKGGGRAYTPDIYSFCRSNFISGTGAGDHVIQGLTVTYRHFVSHKNNLNACHQARFLDARYAKIAFATGAPPRTPLGSLQGCPRPLAGKGEGSQGGKRIGGMERERKGWEGKGKSGKGRGGEAEGRNGREGWRKGRKERGRK